MVIHHGCRLHSHTRKIDGMPNDRPCGHHDEREGNQSTDGTGEDTAGDQSFVHR
jgi:hypothetical protein